MPRSHWLPDAVPRVCAEGEVEQGVEHGGGVHRPLHHRHVRLVQRDREELLPSKSSFGIAKNDDMSVDMAFMAELHVNIIIFFLV